MNWFSCFMSDDRLAKKSFKKSIRDYKEVKSIGSFANIAFRSGKLSSFERPVCPFSSSHPLLFHADSSKRRYITRIGNGNLSTRIFTYRELCSATRNFKCDCLLGEGGFGRVYKGFIDDRRQVIFLIYIHLNAFFLKRDVLIVPMFLCISLRLLPLSN